VLERLLFAQNVVHLSKAEEGKGKRIKERGDRVKREVLLGVIEDFALTTL